MARTLKLLDAARPGIKTLGLKIISLSADESRIEIENPEQAYHALQKMMLARLEKLTEQSPAYAILSTFQELARQGRLVRCHYLDSPMAIQLSREIDSYDRASLPWIDVVYVKPQL